MGTLVTVVTPTYNRARELPRLYDSLFMQTCKDFEWLIIDDGSSDETMSVVQRWTNVSSPKGEEGRGLFPIRYLYKENGGKHTALNVAFREVQTELLFIVDSDDVLTPDAIATIYEDWAMVKGRKLCGISYLRGYSEKQVIGDSFPQDRCIDSFINVRYNQGFDGDKAEVWATKYLRDFQYPETPGERFISESVAWIYLAREHDMLFRNKILYITEYLEGGLTDEGRRLRFQCPVNMAYGSLETMSHHFSWKIRIKETLLYIVYSKFGRKKFREIVDCPYKILATAFYIPGLLLYSFWKWKYSIH